MDDGRCPKTTPPLTWADMPNWTATGHTVRAYTYTYLRKKNFSLPHQGHNAAIQQTHWHAIRKIHSTLDDKILLIKCVEEVERPHAVTDVCVRCDFIIFYMIFYLPRRRKQVESEIMSAEGARMEAPPAPKGEGCKKAPYQGRSRLPYIAPCILVRSYCEKTLAHFPGITNRPP